MSAPASGSTDPKSDGEPFMAVKLVHRRSSPLVRPILALSLVLGAIVLAAYVIHRVFEPLPITSTKGDIYESKEFPGPRCSIRVNAFRERTTGFALSGAIFVIESKARDSLSYIPIWEVRVDDPIPIPDNVVTFCGLDTASVFMHWTCATSSDGGATWKVWNAKQDSLEFDPTSFGYIRTVNFTEDVSGVMYLNPVSGAVGKRLKSSDRGKSWILYREE